MLLLFIFIFKKCLIYLVYSKSINFYKQKSAFDEGMALAFGLFATLNCI